MKLNTTTGPFGVFRYGNSNAPSILKNSALVNKPCKQRATKPPQPKVANNSAWALEQDRRLTEALTKLREENAVFVSLEELTQP